MPAESPCRAPAPRWSDADLDRALAAAERAGLKAYRIEISPDGAIAIVVGSSAGGAAAPEPG
jgi:hypothetical protein